MVQKVELNYDLNLEQEQEIVMTPKMQQAVKLLQLSTLELTEFIQEEVMENPLLELEDNYKYQSSCEQGERVDYKKFVAKEISLEEHLLTQLKMVVEDDKELEIGQYIIGNLDRSGFFTESDKVIKDLGIDIKQVNRVLDKIKSFKPLGIAAEDIKESLQIQLDTLKNKKSSNDIFLAKSIVAEHLELLGKNQIKKIAKKLGIKPTRSQQIVDLIKSLNPIPSNKFAKANSSYLEADIIVKKNQGDYVIIMSQSSFPTLRINSYYRKMLENNQQKDVDNYINDKLNSALWLIKSIEQRRQTIYNIVKAIIEKQKSFLEHGLKSLKAMNMQEIADKIGVHLSTVSRAVTDKYIQTPFGLFPLQYLFCEGVSSTNSDISSIGIKKLIKEIVANEDPALPLSDTKIEKRLKEKGINISRRTVAKYRNQLDIPSSRLRKRYD